MPKLEFSHMAVWNCIGVCSHAWLLRLRFLIASRLLCSLDLLFLCFCLLRAGLVKGGWEGGGGLITPMRMQLACSVSLVAPCRDGFAEAPQMRGVFVVFTKNPLSS